MTGYRAQLAHAKATIPTFKEARSRAMREKRMIVERVLMADDTIATIRFGPRGGTRVMSRT